MLLERQSMSQCFFIFAKLRIDVYEFKTANNHNSLHSLKIWENAQCRSRQSWSKVWPEKTKIKKSEIFVI